MPEGVLDGGLGHAVAADFCHEGCAFLGAGKCAAKDCGREKVLDRGPGALNPFRTVIRGLAGNTLGPAGDPVGVNAEKENTPRVSAAETGLEEVHERHFQFAQRDGVDFHVKT